MAVSAAQESVFPTFSRPRCTCRPPRRLALDNYNRDLDWGAGFHFNSSQPRLHSAIKPGARLWPVTGHPADGTIRYGVAAKLSVATKTLNPPGYECRHRRTADEVLAAVTGGAPGPVVASLGTETPRVGTPADLKRVAQRTRAGRSVATRVIERASHMYACMPPAWRP